MRISGVAVAMAVAACGGAPDGLTIEVVPIGNVSYVELLVPTLCSGGCPGGVRPPGYVQLDASLFEVPASAEVWIAKVSDGVAGFRLTNDTDETRSLPLIAAVGYDGSDQPIAVAVLQDLAIAPGQDDYWRLKLSPAGPVSPEGTRPPDGEYRALAWETSVETLPSCIVIEHGSERFAIGPEEDNDCDEVQTQPECAPWVHLATGRPGTIATANCTRHAMLDSDVDVCMAAGPQCNEAMPSTGCDPIDDDYCLPTAFCSCSPWDLSCIQTKIGAPGYGYLECIVPTDPAGATCASPTYFSGVDVGTYFRGAGSSTASCESVRLHELDATIGPFDNRADFASGTLTVKSFNQPCTIDLEYAGTVADAGYALASLDLDNDKHLVLPVVVRTEQDCSVTPTCAVVNATYNTALSCAVVTPAPASCVPSGQCTEGPPCGSSCCTYGEYCGPNNQCLCGNTGQACAPGFHCQIGPGPSCGTGCCDPTAGGTPACDF